MSKKDQILEEEPPQEPDAGPSSFFPEAGPGLGKEVKIGVAVILGLLIVFGVVVVKRMRRPPEPPAVAEGSDAKPENHSGDKHGPKDLPPGGPLSKSAPPTFLAGKPGSTGLSTNAPKWNPAGDTSRPKDPANDGRVGSPPPSFMPKMDLAGGPGRDRMARSDNVPGNDSPLRTPPGGPTSNKAPTPAGQPFDPFPKQPGPSGLGNSPPMEHVNGISNRPGSAMAGVGKEHGNRHSPPSNPAGSPGTSLAVRDITDLDEPTPRSPMAPRAAASSLAGDPRPSPSRPFAPDTSVPAPRPAFDHSSPAMHRPGSDLSQPPPRVSAATAAYGRADIPPGPRPNDNDAGRRTDGTYVVQPSDSYWMISQRLYGTGSYFRALAEHNRSKFPDENRLTVGDIILAPSVDELQRGYPGLCPKPDSRQARPDRPLVSNASVHGSGGRVYVVQEGDNLFNIAKYEMHNAARWVEIYELNRDLLGEQVDRLKPGMRLTLPDASAPLPRTAGQNPSLRR